MSQLLTHQPTTTEQAWSSPREIAMYYVDGFLTTEESNSLARMYTQYHAIYRPQRKRDQLITPKTYIDRGSTQ